jgi:hypothetical protein
MPLDGRLDWSGRESLFQHADSGPAVPGRVSPLLARFTRLAKGESKQ